MEQYIPHTISHFIFLIFAGTAVLATLALFARQSLLVAYIVLGAILGPWGLKLVTNTAAIKQAGDIGIIFLLFLLGLDLQPQNLFHSLRKMSSITVISSLIFFMIGFCITGVAGYSYAECFVIGLAAMFSSTIMGIKLLPTTILHHQHTGELVISILLLQDILAIIAILALEIFANTGNIHIRVGLVISALPVLVIVAYLGQRYIMDKLFRRFDKIHEYIFILSIGWCLFMAELSHYFDLSEEIGAFIAGVALASSPIAAYISEALKPLRDFFLVLFFFSIGASFNFTYFLNVIVPAIVFAALILVAKPLVFNKLLRRYGEVRRISWEIGIRLGQLSEFSLLLVYMAVETQIASEMMAYMAEAAIIITFLISSYLTIMKYPTPLAATDKLRRD